MKFGEKRVRFDASKCLELCCSHGLLKPKSEESHRVNAPTMPEVTQGIVDLHDVEHDPVFEPVAPTTTPVRAARRGIVVASEVIPGALQDAPPSTSGTQTRRRGRRQTANLSEEEKFDAAITKLVELQPRLQKERDVPQLRSVHIEIGGREASLLTAEVQCVEDRNRFVGLMWQTTHSPPKFVCITFSLSSTGGIVLPICTCNPFASSQCWHKSVASKNVSLMAMVRELLGSGDLSASHFESLMNSDLWEHPETWPILMMPRINEGLGTNANANPREIRQKLKSKWAPWVLFDVDLRLFISVTRRPKTPFQCQLCRNDKRAACDHEHIVRTKAKQLDLYDVTNVEDDAENEPSVEPEDTDAIHHTSAIFKDADTWKYCPTHLTRPVLPCNGEQKIIESLYSRIKNRGASTLSFQDAHFCCRSDGCCDNVPFNEVVLSARTDNITLLKLEHGPVRVKVFDWVCLRCRKQNYYSGRSDGIFPVRKEAAYSTDYLYCLMDLV